VVRRSSTVRASRKLAAVGLVTLFVGLATGGPATSADAPLPLGDSDLVETRTVTELAPGVSLTHISRGTEPAREKDYQTTRRGPWQVRVLTIDPAVATGSLRATYGPDLAPTEKTSELAAYAGAMAAVNASFFTFSSSSGYPGDPVGLGLYDGELLSEPSDGTAEVSLLVDSRTNQISMPGKLSWRERIVNRRNQRGVKIEMLGHPPVVPAKCAKKKNPLKCRQPGDVVRLPAEFSAQTPSGKGVEVVLGRRGCVVRRDKERGTVLKPVQTSIQATGKKAKRLMNITRTPKNKRKTCMRSSLRLRDSAGQRVPTGPWMFGMNGRFTLTRAGQAVVPRGQTSLFHRNPRTFVGRTSAGQVRIVTIDGRQPTSVGAGLRETAAVALALDMPDAINLDGGGSTTMVVNGAVVNQPSGSDEREVGDALIWSATPWARKR
jgi:exopolysaccharide biosynthesis protein